jgi:hypothetical protein
MAHKRADTLKQPPEWAKHLRGPGKRRQARAERAAAKRDIALQLEEAEHAQTVAGALELAYLESGWHCRLV